MTTSPDVASLGGSSAGRVGSGAEASVEPVVRVRGLTVAYETSSRAARSPETTSPGAISSSPGASSSSTALSSRTAGSSGPLRTVAAVGGVDLDVSPGELVAVVGPSGCGKSTLLRVLGGLAPPEARVCADEVAVPRLPDGRPATAWMPQGDSLLPWRRALPNALLGARVAGVDRDEARALAGELFDRFGLAGFERSWPHELSGGMRQRLALLRTCLTGRPLLLLDEPFGALDALTRRRMNAWLSSLDLTGTGRAIVLVTHDVDEALTLADRVLVLSDRPATVVLDLPVPPDDRHVTRDRLLDALGVGPGAAASR